MMTTSVCTLSASVVITAAPAKAALLWPKIIRALLTLLCAALLVGCSAVRLGYNNAATLSYWWLDSYVDFDDAQTAVVRSYLQALHQWHRQQELPHYAQLLQRMQALALQDITAEQTCTVAQQMLERVQRLADQSAQGLSLLVPMVKPEQIEHLTHQLDKRNRQWREQWLEGSLQERQQRRLKAAIERAQGFYGRLQPRQIEVLRESIARSSFDALRSDRENVRRQQDLLRLLREHGQGSSRRAAHTHAESLAFLRRSLSQSPELTYRIYIEQLLSENCATLAALHNSTDTAQRQAALKTLQAYEADVRALMESKP